MRALAICLAAALACSAGAARIILVPIDDRPATGQFAQMVGAVAGVEVDLPPMSLLGRFTKPGSPEALLEWLARQDFSDVIAVVVSTDMIAYGGLIASRVLDVDDRAALRRLGRLSRLRRAHPDVPFYAFAALMRTYPTATLAVAAWRERLAEYVVLRSVPESRRTDEQRARFAELAPQVPQDQLRRYDAVRARNLRIDCRLVEMASRGAFDRLLIGQDDATPAGPHIREAQIIRRAIESRHAEATVQFCEGIDQHACVLVSRAVLRYIKATPRVRVVYSDAALSRRIAAYESRPLHETVDDQIVASGAVDVGPTGSCDYTLYIAIPGTGASRLDEFLRSFEQAMHADAHVALADIDFDPGSHTTARIAASICRRIVSDRLLAFGNWNTASNTVGTVVPAADLAVATESIAAGGLYRTTARLEFLAHRIFGDLGYNDATRPAVYKVLDGLVGRSDRIELHGSGFETAQDFVRRDLAERSRALFDRAFRGIEVTSWGREFEVVGLEDLTISLPWPRAFEVYESFAFALR